MTKAQAMEKAERESRGGFVQHVNATRCDQCRADGNSALICHKAGGGEYVVSDWFDGLTVASFENGVRL